MDNEGNVLVIDDEHFSREYFKKLLEKTRIIIETASTGSEGMDFFKRSTFDLVILDIRLPDANGIDILKKIKEINQYTYVIIITADGTVDDAVRAMKLGAFDFLMKPFEHADKVLNTIKNAIYQGVLEKDNRFLRNRLKSESLQLNMVGKSPVMQKVYDLVKRASQVESIVLIQGESGTGKELTARAIHMNSIRRKSVFLSLDCSGLPETLIETTLFGYQKGAYTGADKTTKGYFEEANGGTLFLDEIGEASPLLQVKLLRCIQERKVIRVGSTTPLTVDVRIIMATNKNLYDEVINNRFRKDLFYRINVIKIDLPPLRDKKDDILPLTNHFIETYCTSMGKRKKFLLPKALQLLINHNWPGNVRELQNVIEKMVALNPGDKINDKDMIEYITSAHIDEQYRFMDCPYENAKRVFEKLYMENLIKKFPKNLKKASEYANIHLVTLYRKMKQHDIRK